MSWNILTTDEFDLWLTAQNPKAQAKIDAHILMLELAGPTLPAKYSKPIMRSRHTMRELRIQVGGDPYRVLHVFDPQRSVVLLLGGDKTGDDRWYDENVPKADKRYDAHLAEINQVKEKTDG
jgi:hypothetical protein